MRYVIEMAREWTLHLPGLLCAIVLLAVPISVVALLIFLATKV